MCTCPRGKVPRTSTRSGSASSSSTVRTGSEELPAPCHAQGKAIMIRICCARQEGSSLSVCVPWDAFPCDFFAGSYFGCLVMPPALLQPFEDHIVLTHLRQQAENAAMMSSQAQPGITFSPKKMSGRPNSCKLSHPTESTASRIHSPASWRLPYGALLSGRAAAVVLLWVPIWSCESFSLARQ